MSGKFAWVPSVSWTDSCNVAQFATSLGIDSIAELRKRSTEDIAWFWDAVVKDLKLDFFEHYSQVVDISNGPQWAKWFVGGKLNIAYNCVDRHAKTHLASKNAIICESEQGEVRSLTYLELYAETNRLANALKSLGIGRGDRVGLMLPMMPEVVISLLAIAKIGAIALPIFSGFGTAAVADRLNDSAAKLLITADRYQRKGKEISLKKVAKEAVRHSPTVKNIVVVGHQGEICPFEFAYDKLVLNQSSIYESESMDSEDPFLIVYTSGTTGRPKGAVHVHGGFLVKIAQEVAHQADVREDDVLYWFTDMGWIMGPWEVIGGLARGATIFLYEGSPDFPDPGRLWSQISRHKISILGVSPTLIRSLMKHGDEFFERHDLKSLRLLGSTGEPWNPDPWRWYFEKIGGGRCPLINFSGGTEVGACLLSPFPCEPIKECSLGGPSLGMDVDVFDSEGASLLPGVGELVCKQPWPGMTRGLWNDPDRYLATYWSLWPNVWTHGDWASIDDDGQWFLHGRSDDTIKVAGKRIGPAEIESVLVEDPWVAEAAAVGIPDELKGERIVAFIVLKPGAVSNLKWISDLRTQVSEALGKPFAPDAIHVVDDLPKTRSAKIVRRAIRAVLAGEDLGDLSSVENPSALNGIRAITG